MSAFNPGGLDHGFTTLGFYGNKTSLTTPGPGTYDPFPLLNPPGFSTSRHTFMPDRSPGNRCVKVATHPSVNFHVRLQKTGGKKLGLRYRQNTMRVEQVLDAGLLAEWNSGNPDQAVFPGDLIIEVNGKNISTHGAGALAREIETKTTLEMGFSGGETMQPLKWQPEPWSISRPQNEQPLVNYSTATFWDWPAQRRKTGSASKSQSQLLKSSLGSADVTRSRSSPALVVKEV
mmetsp:Transcript_7513/g.27596  ORF Transcript_7513/g.27596 Transcript_7513/m.27596 type:complete len:232 (+) Transcript_7513:81-776(+)